MRLNTSMAPSHSVGAAARTASPQISPSVSTNTCRLRPGIFFSPVVPLGAAGLGALDRLAVDNPGAGRRFLAGGGPDLRSEGSVDLLPDAVVPPGVEGVGDGLPRREVMGQHAPGATAPRQVEHRIDDLPQRVGARATHLAIALGEQVLDIVPLEVGQVTGIALPCIGIHVPEVNIDRTPWKDYFLDGH